MRRDSMTNLWNLLLMQQHSTFPHVDIYRTVPEEAVSSASSTQKLSHGQKAAFNALRNMPAFVVALHGPPGTGETYWASKIIILLVQHANKETGEQNLIYCMAATNEQADRFIEEIDHSWASMCIEKRKSQLPLFVYFPGMSRVISIPTR